MEPGVNATTVKDWNDAVEEVAYALEQLGEMKEMGEGKENGEDEQENSGSGGENETGGEEAGVTSSSKRKRGSVRFPRLSL